ncbi:MAG: hypothetical protein COB53_11775 [Elusimicrobia bacterium]|nr:MAG: hypothetical protein COB53_11775 [Elusimicrobiota bacterium]
MQKNEVAIMPEPLRKKSNAKRHGNDLMTRSVSSPLSDYGMYMQGERQTTKSTLNQASGGPKEGAPSGID